MLNWSYNYTWYASDFLLNNYSTGRSYNIAITGYYGWVPVWLNLWNVTASFSAQTLSWQFSWYFWIQDDRGTTWRYTTIQLPWTLTWTTMSWINNPIFSISQSNIYFYWTWWVTVISWTGTASVYINTWIYMTGGVPNYVTFTWAKNYIKRDYQSNPYMCPTGRYGNMPRIKIDIPAWQSPDTYSGIITFDINDPPNHND